MDSSLIAFGIRAKKTFSVAYEDAAFDESALAEQAAAELGSEHHVLKISPSDYFGAAYNPLTAFDIADAIPNDALEETIILGLSSKVDYDRALDLNQLSVQIRLPVS